MTIFRIRTISAFFPGMVLMPLEGGIASLQLLRSSKAEFTSSALNMTCKENFHPPAVLFPVSPESKCCTDGHMEFWWPQNWAKWFYFQPNSWKLNYEPNQSETLFFCSTPPLVQLLGEEEIHYFFPAVPEKLWIPQGVFLKPFPKL